MGVNLLRLVLIERHESIQDVITGSGVVGSTFSTIRILMSLTVFAILVELAFIVREIVLHWRDRKFLFESIDLVEEENDRCLDKPAGVANRVEKRKGLLHSVDGLIFKKQLIVFGYGH